MSYSLENHRHAFRRIRRLGTTIALGVIALGCGRTRGTTQAPEGVEVSTVDAGGGPEIVASDAGSDDVDGLLRVIDESVALVEDARARCGEGNASPDTLVSLRQTLAALYADRDEIKLRQERGDWRGRDVAAWTKRTKSEQAQVRAVAARCKRSG